MTRDPWICELCDRQYVVPSMARTCEERHLAGDDAEETEDEQTTSEVHI